jgi:hypothetical protein
LLPKWGRPSFGIFSPKKERPRLGKFDQKKSVPKWEMAKKYQPYFLADITFF